MIDFCSEHSKVILNPGFFLLDFFLQVVNILLLVSQQKYQLFRKYVGLVHEVSEVRCVTVTQ